MSSARCVSQHESLDVSVVGQGTYGIVYKVKCRSTGKEFALKRYNYGVEDSTVRELSCLAALKGHPYVVSVHDCFFDEGKVAMLLSIPLSFVARFSRQVAHALSCMHEMNIVHRDLTPFNVLLTEDLTVKVADMGLSRQCSKWMSPTVVTEAYRAPELFDECGKYRLEYTWIIWHRTSSGWVAKYE
uniref:Protein kinase domain-containing protein n=1 Tax=Amphiprion percula TaxID=161767 RepID=A0A3P8TSI2_AMPPE